jgi:ubiquitin-conjugating enzyme E2 J2
MNAQLKKACKEPNEYIKFMQSEECHVWYILLSGFAGDHDEFDGGEYLVRMKAPANFPFDPPEFYFMTKNGLYETDTKVCISIGEYHKDQYRAALGMDGFANQLVSGLIGWRSMGGGISITNTDAAAKAKFAKASRASNLAKYGDIIDQLEGCFTTYSAKWDLKLIPMPMQIKLGLVKPLDNDNNVPVVDIPVVDISASAVDKTPSINDQLVDTVDK